MTRKERVYESLKGQKVDGQPYNFNITQKMKDKIGAYYGIKSEEAEKFIGNHFQYLHYDAPEGFVAEKINEEVEKDEFGISWNMVKSYDVGEWGMVDHPVKNMELEGYRFPNPIAKGRFRSAEEAVKKDTDSFQLVRTLGVFELSWRIAGIQDCLMGMALNEEFTNKLFDGVLEFNLGIIEQIPRYVDGVRFISDWGQQKGLMMGAENWRKYLKPRLKVMYEACRKKGLKVFVHSCGDVVELFPDLIELGVDCIDPIQPEVMDLKFIKREYGKDIALFGGLGCQSTIPNGTVEQVIAEAEERMSFLSEGGKYILGPSGSIPQEAPIENVAALVEFCRNLVK